MSKLRMKYKPKKKEDKTDYQKYYDKKVKELWESFSLYIRYRDGYKTTRTNEYVRCCTCNKIFSIQGSGQMQAGHFISQAKSTIRYNEKNVHAQCKRCNVILDGCDAEYKEFMLGEYGQDTVTMLKNASKGSKKYTLYEIEALLEYYKNKVKEFEK